MARIVKFSLGLFVAGVLLFSPLSSLAVTGPVLTKASLLNAYKHYLIPAPTAKISAAEIVNSFRSYVTAVKTPSPILPLVQEERPKMEGVTPPTDASLASTLRSLLSKEEFVSKLRGPAGPQGLKGDPGLTGNSSISYLPVGIAQPDYRANFSGATYSSITNLTSDQFNANTTNITTLNVSGNQTTSGNQSVTPAISR